MFATMIIMKAMKQVFGAQIHLRALSSPAASLKTAVWQYTVSKGTNRRRQQLTTNSTQANPWFKAVVWSANRFHSRLSVHRIYPPTKPWRSMMKARTIIQKFLILKMDWRWDPPASWIKHCFRRQAEVLLEWKNCVRKVRRSGLRRNGCWGCKSLMRCRLRCSARCKRSRGSRWARWRDADGLLRIMIWTNEWSWEYYLGLASCYHARAEITRHIICWYILVHLGTPDASCWESCNCVVLRCWDWVWDRRSDCGTLCGLSWSVSMNKIHSIEQIKF